MRADERREFGEHAEQCKREGVAGSGPNGDYTYAELRTHAREFRGENT